VWNKRGVNRRIITRLCIYKGLERWNKFSSKQAHLTEKYYYFKAAATASPVAGPFKMPSIHDQRPRRLL
jgi:hypothetical protein